MGAAQSSLQITVTLATGATVTTLVAVGCTVAIVLGRRRRRRYETLRRVLDDEYHQLENLQLESTTQLESIAGRSAVPRPRPFRSKTTRGVAWSGVMDMETGNALLRDIAMGETPD